MFSKLNYLWRLLATALSFSIFGIGGLILSLTVFPAINIFKRDKIKRKLFVRRFIQKSFRLFLNMMAKFGMFDFDFLAAEELLKQSEGKIVIANHPSLIDVVAMIAILPNADCIVKENLWKNPFLKGVVSAADYIKNSEDVDKLLIACKRSLSEGYCLIIFPEGTRTSCSRELKIQRGASSIALRCNANLVPVTIRCEPTTLTKNEPWYSIPARKASFSVSVGKDINIEHFDQKERGLSVSARKLTRHIEAYFIEELRVYA